MKGRNTNFIVAITNILVGLAFILFVFLYKQNAAEFTRHQKLIYDYITLGLKGLLIVVSAMNLVYSILNIKEGHLFIYYLITLFSLIFLWQIDYLYSIFLIVSGLLIIKYIKKSNFIEKENTIIIGIHVVLMILVFMISGAMVGYKNIGDFLKKKEEVNLVSYKEDYFKYVTELGDEYRELYINVKGENGKWGYINSSGDKKIEFKYDFATPFYKIKVFDKEFDIASVTEDKVSKVILKNAREVMTYNSEYENENKILKLKEFEKELKDTFKQNEIKLSGYNTYFNLDKKRIYTDEKVKDKKYTYRYDFSEKYDVLVIESQMGNKTKYKFAKKNDINDQIDINAENLLYDKTGLYVFKNGYLPFYSPNKNEQGWFEPDGKRKIITGKIQILDVDQRKILIKNYNKNVSYFIDYETKAISPLYKNIIKFEDKYIVKTSDTNKWTIIDQNLNNMLQANEGFDVFSAKLIKDGILLFANLPEKLQFDGFDYLKLEYIIVNKELKIFNSKISSQPITDIYNLFNKIVKKENENAYDNFIEKLKRGDIVYPGDEFYKNNKIEENSTENNSKDNNKEKDKKKSENKYREVENENVSVDN